MEDLFEKNIPYALKIAHGYSNWIYEKEDIEQLALIGLWQAVKTYDGVRTFNYYARACIVNSINLYLKKLRKMPKTISIHKSITDDEKITIEDVLPDEISNIEELESNLFSNEILSAIENEKHRNVIKRLIIEKEKEACIARELNVSRQRISGIKVRCLNKLREKVKV